MSRPKTPAELRAAAALLREKARALRVEAAGLDVTADEFDAWAAKGLTMDVQSDTIQTQMHVESAGAGRSRGQLDEASLEHPFVKMLVKRKISVADVAAVLSAKLGRTVPRSSLQATYKKPTDPAYRAIKRDVADLLKAEYGVPLSAWPRISE